jgi:radical SAM superfamily enzyme YgiQ (UPF0313 family)
MKPYNILLINPWIYDFAAYDLWSRPLGLLYIGGLLRANGYNISLINCLDRYHPDLMKYQNLEKPKNNEYGCGKFHKEIIERPSVLEHVPRKYGRYGLPLHIFQNELKKVEKPDVILVTSGMTYWYPGAFEVIRQVKSHFPEVPVLLGGTYATLCYDHAVANSGADYVVCGEGEHKALELVRNLNFLNPPNLSIDDYPYPAYDLLTSKESLAILTSRGCPMGCTYCASRLVAGEFRQRNPLKVADEIEFYHKNYGTKNFAFYDDALLLNADDHISIILKEIIRRGINCHFHTPNAMHANMISSSLAKLMFKSGFKTIRISLETSNIARQKIMGDKVTPEKFRDAVAYLKEAGYSGRDIGIYVLICLPGQSLEEMIESIKYVYECGAVTKLAVYSPIPETEEWQKAVKQYQIGPNADPLLHNDSIYPIRLDGLTIEDIQRVKAFALECNNLI